MNNLAKVRKIVQGYDIWIGDEIIDNWPSKTGAMIHADKINKAVEAEMQLVFEALDKAKDALILAENTSKEGGHASDYEGISVKCPHGCDLCQIQEALSAIRKVKR